MENAEYVGEIFVIESRVALAESSWIHHQLSSCKESKVVSKGFRNLEVNSKGQDLLTWLCWLVLHLELIWRRVDVVRYIVRMKISDKLKLRLLGGKPGYQSMLM